MRGCVVLHAITFGLLTVGPKRETDVQTNNAGNSFDMVVEDLASSVRHCKVEAYLY